MNRDEYFKSEKLSRSDYLKFKRSSKDGAYQSEQEFKRTDAMDLGSAFHKLMELNGNIELFKEHVAVFDDELRPVPEKDYRTALNRVWKMEFFEENEDKIVISADELVRVLGMRKSVIETEFYKKMITQGIEHEVAFENDTDKCLADAISTKEDYIIVADWKTTSDKLTQSERNMTWSIRKWNLNVQQVHYTNVIESSTKKNVIFVFVFVESSAPFEVLPVMVGKESELYKDGEQILKNCKENHKAFMDGNIYGVSDGLMNGILTIN